MKETLYAQVTTHGGIEMCIGLLLLLLLLLIHTRTLSVGVGRTSGIVCLVVCLQQSKKTNDPKMSKLGEGMILRCPRSDMVLGLKGERSRSQGQ